MQDNIEIKINLKLTVPSALVVRKNEVGLESTLLEFLDRAKRKYPGAPFLDVLIPPKTENKERLIEFAESRRCLKSALDELSPGKDEISKTFVSLSHTGSHSTAFVCLGKGTPLLGVGVDLENTSREITPEAVKKFKLKSEDALPLTPLELWTIKEASFKANSKLSKTNMFLYEIKEFNPTLRMGKTGPVGSTGSTTRFKMHSLNDLLITVATTL